MKAADLAELDVLLASARAVVPMREIAAGCTDADVIGLRHDVDDNRDSLDTAVKIAVWEHERGYRSTFFMLHTASYWTRPDFAHALTVIGSCGHEIGIHTNAITAALTNGGDPAEILELALAQLRRYVGDNVIGVAPHGDRLCYSAGFINDEIFAECPRPKMGAPDRWLEHDGRYVKLDPKPLAYWGLEYETYRLPHGRYLSDSGGKWNVPLHAIPGDGQLHILWHPDWWAEALKENP